MTDLYRHSIDVILRSQAPSGAYVASPTFASYAYCWLRDGSFTAHAMDRAGRHDSARAFLLWTSRTIERHADRVDRAVARVNSGQPLRAGDYLPTRYTVHGDEAGEQWWDFQLDGYGAWLWAAGEHLRMTGDRALGEELAAGVALTTRYLVHLWRLPGYDLWEEHADYLHPYTLSAVYAGLRAAFSMGAPLPADVLSQIRNLVLTRGILSPRGPLVKSFRPQTAPATVLADRTPAFHDSADATTITSTVDASLLGVSTPFALLEPGHPAMQSTVDRIEETLLRPGGGVYRYRGDTYYGGGEWVLLAAWLGWHRARTADLAGARDLLCWIEAQTDDGGNLPEQVSDHLLAPERFDEWRERWGPVASPLVWSHAMYLILVHTLKESE